MAKTKAKYDDLKDIIRFTMTEFHNTITTIIRYAMDAEETQAERRRIRDEKHQVGFEARLEARESAREDRRYAREDARDEERHRKQEAREEERLKKHKEGLGH